MSNTPHTDKLDSQHRMFVMEYLRDFSHTKAGKRVSMSDNAARKAMGNPDVLAAIEEQAEARRERVKVDSDWVLAKLGHMFDADIADLFEHGTNRLRPVHQWPEIWRKSVQSVKVREIWSGRGDEREQIGEVVDAKLIDKLKAIELIGKHTDVKAFTERLEVATDAQLTDQLVKARKRAAARNGGDSTPPSFL